MQAKQPLLFSRSASGGWAFATILHWEHRSGRQAHCLARVFRSSPVSRPTVVLSEISSNPDGRGLSDDVPAVAGTLLRAMPPHCSIRPEDVIWIVHHGDFSYPDALDAPEVFTVVPLQWGGIEFDEDMGQRKRLRGDDLRAVLGSADLAPVSAVLEQLSDGSSVR